MTIQDVLREWHAHLPPKAPAGGLRGHLAVALGWVAIAMVYAIAVLIVVGIPAATLVLVLHIINR